MREAALVGPPFGEEGKLNLGRLSSHSWEGYGSVGEKLNTVTQPFSLFAESKPFPDITSPLYPGVFA